MKKFLLIALLLITSSFVFAQVTVTIDNVTPTTNGKVKGDLITYTVSAPTTDVWGTGFDVTFSNGETDGAGGLWNPHVLSYKTYTLTVMTDIGDFSSDPYTVTAK